ncbi:hypothetical protein G4G28_15805 [Massilia sp. Dwa41.01b]|uniref:hypothetical protein n=1 Tax=Massilia sp. Dwa41.01b TaxID=2709302 RepID=UPI001604820E|nr:hypothetical protein [Massilia sp. Dwa41.01b]QNA89570.1 hypothetical protein G4G28_15805 [Massilia sp. Dwa41.01b]
MFEFLFKRQGGKSGEGRGAQADGPGSGAGGANAPSAGTGTGAAGAAANTRKREQQAEQLKSLGGDEMRAVEFILHADFSELRLAAAEHLHSREALERVHTAMRNLDRRVAKLTQARLDALRHHDAELARGQAVLDSAQALEGDAHLTPNQVADLDRKWSVIKAPELAEAFAAVRARLGTRLETQVQLQRAMIDRLAALRRLETAGLNAAELAASLERMGQEQEAALAAPEHASLPRALVAEFAAEHARLHASLATLEQAGAALAAREALLAEWQAQPPAELHADNLRKAWQKLPAPPADVAAAAAAALQARFDALLASLPQPVRKREPAPVTHAPGAAHGGRQKGPDAGHTPAPDHPESEGTADGRHAAGPARPPKAPTRASST